MRWPDTPKPVREQELGGSYSIALFQVRDSVKAVTDTVGLRALIASRADLALLVSLLPSVCMTVPAEVGHLHFVMVHHRDAYHAAAVQE